MITVGRRCQYSRRLEFSRGFRLANVTIPCPEGTVGPLLATEKAVHNYYPPGGWAGKRELSN